MDAQKLAELLGERNALEVFRSLDIKLAMLTPNGALNHRLANVKSFIYGRVRMYGEFDDWPQNETFSQYKKRDSKDYSEAIKYIAEAIEKFHVTI